MVDVKDRYFSLNRTLLITVGLWPHRTSTFIGFRLCCIYIILITSIIFQLTPLLTVKCTGDLIIKIFSVVSFYVCFTIQYISFHINGKTMQKLLEQLQCICDNFEGDEMVIMDKYGNIARRYTTALIYFVVLAISGSSVSFGSQLYLLFHRVNSTVNNSLQRRQQHVQLKIIEYFLDYDRYSYFVLLHIITACWIGICIIVATGTMLITNLQCACGMFSIARFRIEHTVLRYKHFHKCKNNSLLNETEIYKYIIYAIDIHRKAIWFSTYLMSNFDISFLFLIIFGVLSLSLNIFRMFQIVTSTFNIFELLLYSIFAIICAIYVFLSNFVGQKITDHNNDIFASVYKIPWYTFPLRLQRLILLLLQRGNKGFGLNVGKLFTASLQCFASLVNASVSCITLMYSTR